MDAEDRDVIRCYHDYNCINWLFVCLFVFHLDIYIYRPNRLCTVMNTYFNACFITSTPFWCCYGNERKHKFYSEYC